MSAGKIEKTKIPPEVGFDFWNLIGGA